VLVVAWTASRGARAAEAPSVDEEGEGAEEIADEALGPRGNLRTRAQQVSFDPQQRTLELSGDVRVDAPPFHLRSERIRLSRTRYGIEVDGKGTLAFCPCLGTPLRVDFDHAIVAPPGDLILKDPTLRFYGVPVLPLPYFWLRSDEKLGVLPPDLAYRGQDGFFVGGGAHVPWKSRGQKLALDLRSGWYTMGGFAIDARLRTPVSTTAVRYDRLPGAPAPSIPGTPESTDDGVVVDARGATHDAELGVAWDVDAIRGRRGVVATTDLDAAAKPYDRAAVEGSLRPSAGPFVVSTGVRAVMRRGGGPADVDAVGPVTSLRASGAAGSFVTYDATVEGGALRVAGASVVPGSPTPDAMSFARAELGVTAAATAGPIGASLSLRSAGDVAADAKRNGADRAGTARVHVGAPLARAYGGGGDDRATMNDPWVHVVEPFVEGAVLAADGDAILGTRVGRAAALIEGTAPVAEAGAATTLGRWGKREAVDLAVSAGSAFDSRETRSGARPLARGRAAATLAWVGAWADGAAVAADDLARPGWTAVARTRIGRVDRPRLLGSIAARDGVDPVLARLLGGAELQPPAGFLATEATTGNAALVVPWSNVVTTSLGADGDATRGELVAARAGLELRDRCGCLTLRANGSHRLGRGGVDVWIALDFASNR
jgi:hypothetical protein